MIKDKIVDNAKLIELKAKIRIANYSIKIDIDTLENLNTETFKTQIRNKIHERLDELETLTKELDERYK